MVIENYLIAGTVAVLAGLDRMAVLQIMISRPIVAAPLAGWLLGAPLVGLQVGGLLELLWLGRLPVGAAIPPDDTQVAVGSVALAVTAGRMLDYSEPEFVILCMLVAIPLGKCGQVFDRMARDWNGKMLHRAEMNPEVIGEGSIERYHLQGLIHFALSSLATFTVILVGGLIILNYTALWFIIPVGKTLNWLSLAFPLIGAAVIIGTINVSRSMSLFGASFATVILIFWIL